MRSTAESLELLIQATKLAEKDGVDIRVGFSRAFDGRLKEKSLRGLLAPRYPDVPFELGDNRRLRDAGDTKHALIALNFFGGT